MRQLDIVYTAIDHWLKIVNTMYIEHTYQRRFKIINVSIKIQIKIILKQKYEIVWIIVIVQWNTNYIIIISYI